MNYRRAYCVLSIIGWLWFAAFAFWPTISFVRSKITPKPEPTYYFVSYTARSAPRNERAIGQLTVTFYTPVHPTDIQPKIIGEIVRLSETEAYGPLTEVNITSISRLP